MMDNQSIKVKLNINIHKNIDFILYLVVVENLINKISIVKGIGLVNLPAL